MGIQNVRVDELEQGRHGVGFIKGEKRILEMNKKKKHTNALKV